MRPRRAADHSPSSSAAVMEEYSYTSTHPLGHTGPVTRSLYLIYIYIFNNLIILVMKAIFMQNTNKSQNFFATIQCLYLVS